MRQLQDMRRAAYGLGMKFACVTEAEDDHARRMEFFKAFEASFESVRLSVALEIRLEAAGRSQPARPAPERTEAAHRPDRAGRPERGDERKPERDRERDRETVSLPILLRTLNRVADDAQALMPEAAELPALREGLDQLDVRAVSEPAPRRKPPSPDAARALRTRLAGGTAAPTLELAPAPALSSRPHRRSTGPPRR